MRSVLGFNYRHIAWRCQREKWSILKINIQTRNRIVDFINGAEFPSIPSIKSTCLKIWFGSSWYCLYATTWFHSQKSIVLVVKMTIAHQRGILIITEQFKASSFIDILKLQVTVSSTVLLISLSNRTQASQEGGVTICPMLRLLTPQKEVNGLSLTKTPWSTKTGHFTWSVPECFKS